MDTKLKNYNRSKIFKIMASILVIVSFALMVVSVLEVVYKKDTDLIAHPFEEDYFLSENYRWTVTDNIRDIMKLIEYENEENIKQGNTIVEELKSEKEIIFERFVETQNYNDSLTYEENYKRFEKEYISDYSEEIEGIKSRLIKKDLREFNRILSRLSQNKDFVYYVKQGDIRYTNTEKNKVDDFKKYPAYVISDGNRYEYYPREVESVGEEFAEIDQIQIAFTEDFINERLSDWNNSRDIIKNLINRLLILSAVLILSLIYLFVTTGKQGFKDGNLTMSKIDRLYTDVNLVYIAVIIFVWTGMTGVITGTMGLPMVYLIIISALACGLVLCLLLSLVRHIKNKTIFSNSLIFVATTKIYRSLKSIYDSGSIAVKVAVAVVVYPVLVAITFFMSPVTIVFAVWLTHRKAKEYIEIKKGVEKIKNGDMNHKIMIEHNGEFKTLAEDINSIGEGFNSAISNELKSEKLKTELITNVSHDIRTPLTSIITYVDLLKKEKDESKRKEYIEIIEQKSLRLKTLTDDLFEASKASSGNIPVNFEKIDIVSLITQGLGELDTQVRKSQLEFKMSNPSDKIYVNADGRLLWRSIENLLTNIFKYALKGSRVYIDIVDLEDNIELSIKNISAYELNISSDELMERFKRGDESRTSEGSGLGLSISKSLIEAQGGKFSIEIDGDLFKVIIVIEKYR